MGCGESRDWEKEAEQLLFIAQELNQRHRDLDSCIKELWALTSRKLRDELPADLPPVDRHIFLNSNSAYHMRMFMSYNKLNEQVHKIVDNAAEMDEILAIKLRLLAEQYQKFEIEKYQFFKDVSQADPQIYHRYVGKFKLIQSN